VQRTWWASLAVIVVAAAASVPAQRPARGAAHRALARQVLLDRAGFSPGEIDGEDGSNTAHALSAYTQAHEVPLGTPDDAAIRGTPGAGVTDTLVSYTITLEDVAGPYSTIPDDVMAKAKLKKLGYTSMIEALGERVHAAPALLLSLNAGTRFVAGARINVPNVANVEARAPLTAARVVVSRGGSSLTVFDAEGTVVFYARHQRQ
jgi:peptidoglycan hydrolase-like protein with peptidoglycan-binding domain